MHSVGDRESLGRRKIGWTRAGGVEKLCKPRWPWEVELPRRDGEEDMRIALLPHQVQQPLVIPAPIVWNPVAVLVGLAHVSLRGGHLAGDRGAKNVPIELELQQVVFDA